MQHPTSPRFAVVGQGRLGTALHRALMAAGFNAGDAPLGRGATGEHADVVVLCVPDRAIAQAAAGIAPAGSSCTPAARDPSISPPGTSAAPCCTR